MKKAILTLALLVTFLFGGCMNLNVVAPQGKVIKLGRKSVKAKIVPTKQKDVYYALWGLVPLTNNSTEDLLSDVSEDSKVIVESRTTTKNFIMNIFTGLISITSQNLAVEEEK